MPCLKSCPLDCTPHIGFDLDESPMQQRQPGSTQSVGSRLKPLAALASQSQPIWSVVFSCLACALYLEPQQTPNASVVVVVVDHSSKQSLPSMRSSIRQCATPSLSARERKARSV